MRESAHDDKNFEKSFSGEIVSATRREAAGTVRANKIKGLAGSIPTFSFFLLTFNFFKIPP